MRRHPNNSSLPQLKLNLPFLLLPQVANAKGLARSSKPNLVRVTYQQEPLPDRLKESRSGNPLLPPRMWLPLLRPPRHGNLHSCWMVSLSLPPRVYGYRRRVKGVMLRNAWCVVYFCSRTSILSRMGQTSRWVSNYNGILLW